MGRICYIYTSSTGYSVPTATKCICYFAVGGGGGGAYPQQVRGLSPQAGGSTSYSAGGPFAGGGGPGGRFP